MVYEKKVSVERLFERDHTGIWVFGDPVIDYETKVLSTSKNKIKLRDKDIQFDETTNGIQVVDGNKILLQVNLPMIPDNSPISTCSLAKGGKYTSGETSGSQYILLAKDQVEIKVGGGMPNMALPIKKHSPTGILVVTGLRPEHNGGHLFSEPDQTIDMLVEGESLDAGNLVISGLDSTIVFDKIVGRGPPNLYGKEVLPFEFLPESYIGTYVLNSSRSEHLIREFLKQYLSAKTLARQNGLSRPLEVICLTSKMSDFYDDSGIGMSRRAINEGALAIFNAEEAVKYGLRREFTNPALNKKEKDLKYSDIILALKNIREEQQNKQRVYVTLGEYGCIAMDENGDIYRTNSFDIDQIQSTNGAGDRMASMIVVMENERAHTRNYHVLDVMAAATATAGSFIQDGDVSQEAIKELMYSKGKLDWEYIGNAKRILPGDDIFIEKIGNDPIKTQYNVMRFEKNEQ